MFQLILKPCNIPGSVFNVRQHTQHVYRLKSYLFILIIHLASVWFEFGAPAFKIAPASLLHRLAVWIMSDVLSFTQENAVDLHSVGTVP
jgi:hypothetical protein